MNTFKSSISNREYPSSERVLGKSVRKSIMNLILKENPEFTADHYLSSSELNEYRQKYHSGYLANQIGEITDLERKVLESLNNQSTLSDKMDDDDEKSFTFGQRVADRVASFGGSWKFIILFGAFIFVWILINIFWLANHESFDPYPFILLNLILSCLAALQAPVIMMSQNRQEEKDRDRAKNDYMVNLKSELEIRMLHEKIDHLILTQQQEALEMHKVQLDVMKEILEKVKSKE